jgi:hypothetical protein
LIAENEVNGASPAAEPPSLPPPLPPPPTQALRALIKIMGKAATRKDIDMGTSCSIEMRRGEVLEGLSRAWEFHWERRKRSSGKANRIEVRLSSRLSARY